MNNSIIKSFLIKIHIFGFIVGAIFPVYSKLFVNYKTPTHEIIFIISAIFAGLLVGSASYFLTKRIILKTITELANNLNEIENKNNLDVKIEIESNDEIGLLVSVIKSMLETKKQIVSIASSIALGDFTREITPKSENDELALALIKMTKTLKEISCQTEEIAKGNFDIEVNLKSKDDNLGKALQLMTSSLKETSEVNKKMLWKIRSQSELSEAIRGALSLEKISRYVIRYLCKKINGKVGAFYIVQGEDIVLFDSYAFIHRKELSNKFKVGEGLLGESVREKKMIILENAPSEFFKIKSGIGSDKPKNIIALPFITNEEVVAIAEIGSFEEFTEQEIEFLQSITETVAIVIASASARIKTEELLETSQAQERKLQAQKEEIELSNKQMRVQQEELQSTNEELQAQQEELRVSNEELEEKTEYLEKQKNQILKSNQNLEEARTEIMRKAKELEVSSKYKSEFLANMSHELRTPLNSLLILSKKFSKNKKGNLTERQVEAAKIIYNSGNGLLNMINEILDLSKIEAGKLNVSVEKVKLSKIKKNMVDLFKPLLSEKRIDFSINIDPNLDKYIITDKQKLEQILKNLLSNASKFTEKGAITLTIKEIDEKVDFENIDKDPHSFIEFSVLDTGIGIAENKHLDVFEAFQQADGTTSRKYGGTGLGLSITRELSRLLGGDIKLESSLGNGSKFRVFLPRESKNKEVTKNKYKKNTDSVLTDSSIQKTKLPMLKLNNNSSDFEENLPKKSSTKDNRVFPTINDDRDDLEKSKHRVLIIEDDLIFAKILYDFCNERDFQCIHASDGEKGLLYAKEFEPDAIILDINLPKINGKEVLEQLKSDKLTKNIPVQIMSGNEHMKNDFNENTVGFLTKPVKPNELENTLSKFKTLLAGNIKKLLIIEDDQMLRLSIRELFDSDKINILSTGTGKMAMKLLSENEVDCIILDLGLSDMSGFDLLETINKNNQETPPVVIYTGRDLTSLEEKKLNNYTDSIVIKGSDADQRLLDEVTLFLYSVTSDLKNKTNFTTSQNNKDFFVDKKILIVDDDIRNIFVLDGEFQELGVNDIFKASNGEEALEILKNNKDMDIVLMDIMMPIMDGYETMEKIREQSQFKQLPIIALTAKAMKKDREKSILAGANEYISKPLDIEHLLSTMRVWLSK